MTKKKEKKVVIEPIVVPVIVTAPVRCRRCGRDVEMELVNGIGRKTCECGIEISRG